MNLKTLLLPVLLFLFLSEVRAQGFQSFVNHVNSLSDPTAKMAAVDSFMLANPELPHIYSDSATFIFRGDESSVYVSGDFNGWEEQSEQLTLLADTDLWYTSKTFELNALLDYLFLLNGTEWTLDPNNPHTQQHGTITIHSVLAMPDYVWPWEVNEYPDVPKGTIEDLTISSDYTNRTYEIQIYLPHDYQPTGNNGYPTAYFNDGNGYLELMKAVNILDNLIDSMLITEVIGIFITPDDREEEYYGSDRYNHSLFLVNELVPYIDSAYNTQAIPEKRAIIGVSASANIATLTGYNYAAIFGNIGLHSAALIYNNWEAFDLVVNGLKKDIKWVSIWGSYDIPWLVPNMRSFRDELLSKGYDLEWRELPEGHTFGLFKATTDDILIYFFPPGSVGVKEAGDLGVLDFRVFPNPATDQVSVSFLLEKSSSVSLKLLDVKGQVTTMVIDNNILTGYHEIPVNIHSIPPGIYFLMLEAEGKSISRKLIIY